MLRKADPSEGVALTDADGNAIRVSGALTFASARRAIEAFRPYCQQRTKKPLLLDLAAVTRMDSAGLALLLQWKRMAHAAGRPLRFSALPEQARNLAAVFGVADLIDSSSTR